MPYDGYDNPTGEHPPGRVLRTSAAGVPRAPGTPRRFRRTTGPAVRASRPARGPTGSAACWRFGALVLHVPADLDGREIEISPRQPGTAAAHDSKSAAPPYGDRDQYAAVYPDLAAGAYTIWADEQNPAAGS